MTWLFSKQKKQKNCNRVGVFGPYLQVLKCSTPVSLLFATGLTEINVQPCYIDFIFTTKSSLHSVTYVILLLSVFSSRECKLLVLRRGGRAVEISIYEINMSI